MCCAGPVSYTHLDVYKRQLYDRFTRESNIGEKLDHPKVMRVFGGEKRSRIYMVMEWCGGRLLRQILHEGRISQERAIRIAKGILEALQYIHANGCLLYTSRCV